MSLAHRLHRAHLSLRPLLAPLVAGLALSLTLACASERSQVKQAPVHNEVAENYQAPAPPPEGAPTVIVSDLEGRVEGVDVTAYTAFVRRGLAQSRRAFVVLQSEQASLLGNCQTEACLQRVQHESASARFLCTGNIARLGDSWVVSLSLINVQKGTTLQRVMKRGNTDIDALVVAAATELGQSLPALQ